MGEGVSLGTSNGAPRPVVGASTLDRPILHSPSGGELAEYPSGLVESS